MNVLQPFLVVLHVLGGVFWAGSTFVLARTAAAGIESLARPQLGAAAITVIAGTILFGVSRGFDFGTYDYVLVAGILAAFVAFGLQISALPTLRRLGTAPEAEEIRSRSRLAVVQRMAAVCLAGTVASMVLARYV